MRPYFQFYKDFGDLPELQNSNPPKIPSSHFFDIHKNHIGGLRVKKESYNSGFGGQAWPSLKMTNDSLPQGIYTCIFEIFAIGNSCGFRTNETLIQDVGGPSHYKMITFNHIRVSGQYLKAFIQFSSDGQPGEITFEMRHYGTQFNQNIQFFF